MKKISALLTLGLAFYTVTNVAIAYDFNSTEKMQFDDDDDDFAIDTDLNNIALDSSKILPMTRSTLSNAEQIYALFDVAFGTNPTGVAILFNTPIYQQTSSIRDRPILEYPFTLPYGFDMRANNTLSFDFFFNQWSHKNFTKTSTNLGSYFLLGNPIRFAELEIIDEISGTQTIENLGKSLALFDPAIIQESRMGGVLQSRVVHNNIFLTVQLPILYAERNLYLTPSQKAAVSVSSIGKALEGDGVDQNDFIYKHIVMDQFGFGDLKFKAMYAMHSSPTFDIDLGGFVILPTATALKQGMIGTWFDANNERGYLDIATINPQALTLQNQDDIANFFLAAVDKLSSNVLNCPLGNNGHVVIAPSVNFDWYFSQNWQFSNDFSAQIPLPSREQRFYQKAQTTAEFLNDYNAAFEQGATNALVFTNFLNQELQNLFFPYVFSTMVYPGTVFNSTNQFVYAYHDWDFYIGGNFWYQSAESLKPFINTQNNQTFAYDYTGAASASAAQEKLFAKVNWNSNSTNYIWSISLYGDITVWNSGIGKDFTLGVFVDCRF